MSDEPLDPLLTAMIAAAIEAGRAAFQIYQDEFAVVEKADRSPVTAADHAAEAIILRHLAMAAGAIPVVAEEQASAGHLPRVADNFFLVDPLDGTKEFIGKRADFTVNLALIRNAEPALGVVYAPAKRWLFAGDVSRRSAFRSDQSPLEPVQTQLRPIRVRPVPVDGIVAVASRSHRSSETDAYLARYSVTQTVSVGSSLKFCLVATGEADLYPRLGTTMEWDTAAGQAVLMAAGGSVLAIDGQPLRYGKPDFRNPWFVASGPLSILPLALSGNHR